MYFAFQHTNKIPIFANKNIQTKFVGFLWFKITISANIYYGFINGAAIDVFFVIFD